MKIIPNMWQYAEAICHDDMVNDPLFKKAINFIPLINDLDSCYLAEFEDKLIICFAGTKNLEAWISDFTTYPLKDECFIHKHDGKICHGFYEGWIAYKDIIFDYIRRMSIPRKPIFCTGHSRGGVLACICAGAIAEDLGYPVSCISFGSPAPGNKAYRDKYDLLSVNYTRVVHSLDIVTTVPPDALGFKQPGKLFKLDESVYSWIPEWVRKLMLRTRVIDHYWSAYTKALINYCKKEKDEDGLEAMKEVLKRAKP